MEGPLRRAEPLKFRKRDRSFFADAVPDGDDGRTHRRRTHEDWKDRQSSFRLPLENARQFFVANEGGGQKVLRDQQHGDTGAVERRGDLVTPLLASTQILVAPDVDEPLALQRCEIRQQALERFLVVMAVTEEDPGPGHRQRETTADAASQSRFSLRARHRPRNNRTLDNRSVSRATCSCRALVYCASNLLIWKDRPSSGLFGRRRSLDRHGHP